MFGEEALLKEISVRRGWRIPKYAGLAASGVFASLQPSQLVIQQTSYQMAVVWSIAMTLSSLVCLFGSVTDRWIGEYSGLPLLASVLALYGGSAILAYESGHYIILAYGTIVVSFACSLMARWIDLREIKRAALAGGSERRGA